MLDPCMAFDSTFRRWLDNGVRTPVPANVVAFSFNLYEPAGIDGVKFGIELIGAEKFDPNDRDWACEEVWEPEQRQLAIPIEFSGLEWQACLEKMRTVIAGVLEESGAAARALKSRSGVGIGFVDGDLHVLWERV